MTQKIKETIDFIKTRFLSLQRQDFFLIIAIILISVTSFGLGRLSAIRELKTPIQIQEISFPFKLENEATQAKVGGQASNLVKASINGTKYYYPWCSGLKRIKIENIIEFTSAKEAELSGYELAARCSPR